MKHCTALPDATLPGRRQRLAAYTVAGILAAVALAAMPFGAMTLAGNDRVVVALCVMAWLSDLVTSALLFSQPRRADGVSTAGLAVAYLFSAVAAVPYLLDFPGAFASPDLANGSAIGQPGGSFWLWCFRSAGFACCVAVWALRHDRARFRRLRFDVAWFGRVQVWLICAATVGVVAAATSLIIASQPALPRIHVAGHLSPAIVFGVGPALMLMNAGALGIVAVRLRGRTVVTLWVAVTMVAACLEAILVLHGGRRFTVDWYAAKTLRTAGAIIVPAALIAELISLFNKLVSVNVELLCTAFHDDLTQLPNRPFFLERLTGTLRQAQERACYDYAVMFIDLNRFKLVNDSFGHEVGDLLLVEVAKRLKSCLRPQDTLARLGGDEFAIILEDVADPRDAVMVARRIVETVRRPLRLREHDILPSCSVGVVQGSDHYSTPEALLRDADCAMYQSKRQSATGVTILPALRPVARLSRDLPRVRVK